MQMKGVGGMAQILLARQDGNRIVSASYLVDYWCLGVKDVIPPESMGSSRYERFKQLLLKQFHEPFVESHAGAGAIHHLWSGRFMPAAWG